MAGTGTQDPVHSSPELLQQIQRHKRLDGAGKTTAVDTACAPPAQQALTQSQRHRHFLVVGISCRYHILQHTPAGEAGLCDQSQEGVKITFPQSLHLTGYPTVIIIDMDSPQDSPIPRLQPESRQSSL